MPEQALLEKNQTFDSFELDARLTRAIAQLNFSHPTLVQAKAIPLALAGKDIVARARTGSGKTAAFSLPIIHKILTAKERNPDRSGIAALILVPTRELAEQVTNHIKKLSVYAKDVIRVVNLAGSMSIALQKPILAENPDILVATPSKALAHLEAKNMMLSDTLENLVIDEADLVLSFGYEEDVQKILTYLPKIYQSFLMSATITKDVDELKQMVMRKPVILRLEDDEDISAYLSQYVVKCSEFEKFLYTFVIIKLRLIRGKIIIFVNDIDRCYKLKLFLEQFSIKSCVLNSELPLNTRYHIVEEFNRGLYDYLIASDESQLKGEQDTDDEASDDDDDEQTEQKQGKAKKTQQDKEYGVSRGIDFQGAAAVINFDFPSSSKSYTHRVGRTARGGQRGIALSFVVTPEKLNEHKDLARDIARGRGVTDGKVFDRVVKHQEEKNAKIKPYAFDKKNVDGFKYRVQDALKAVNKMAVKEARITELKREILNSEKLKAHFEDKPKDYDFLRHDRAIKSSQIKPHLKHIPSYLMPRITMPSANAEVAHELNVTFHGDKKRRKQGNHGHGPNRNRNGKKQKTDPLKIIRRR